MPCRVVEADSGACGLRGIGVRCCGVVPRRGETKSGNPSRFFPDPIGVPRRRRGHPSTPPGPVHSGDADHAPPECENRTQIAQELLAQCGTASNDFAQRQPSANHSLHSCFSLQSPCAPLMPFVLGTFEATRMRSLAIIPAHTIMFQVLTGMRSSRTHRMWSDLCNSSIERGRALRDAATHRPRAVCAV